VPDPEAREHEIAEELQASLLPENAFDLEHLDVASYYWAGGQGTQVGGDWYDVISLRGGRTALVVGDVMGRGVQAAAVMAQLRTAVRAYARLGLAPDELLTSLDDLVRELFPEQIVTGIYAVFDPADHSLSFVNAGHVPALVTRADGECTLMSAEVHPPLGMGVPFDLLHSVDLQPRDGVLLYTDGLVERRGEDLDKGIETLRSLVAGLHIPVADVPELLAKTMLPQGPNDDVAILVARVRP
jgi:serine phosphatase RsbU (regulator of sigma subunit)